jgi:acetyl esterase/lipase
MASVATRALSVWLRVFMKPRVATAERARARMAKPKGDPEPSASLRRRHLVTVRTVEGFPCYTVAPRSAVIPGKALVYLHGGAYVSEIARAFHVYPLAPVPEARIAVGSIVHALAEPAPAR